LPLDVVPPGLPPPLGFLCPPPRPPRAARSGGEIPAGGLLPSVDLLRGRDGFHGRAIRTVRGGRIRAAARSQRSLDDATGRLHEPALALEHLAVEPGDETIGQHRRRELTEIGRRNTG